MPGADRAVAGHEVRLKIRTRRRSRSKAGGLRARGRTQTTATGEQHAIAIRRSADGPQLVTVPELFNRAPNTKTDQVTVLVLPAPCAIEKSASTGGSSSGTG